MWIFSRTTDDRLASLVKRIDSIVADNTLKKATSLAAFVGDDPDVIRASVKDFGEAHVIDHVVLGMPKRHDIGDRQLRLGDDAIVTVMIAEKRKVIANHAWSDAQFDDAAIEKIAAEFEDILH